MASTSTSYAETYARSLRDPEGFWAEQARLIDWIRRPQGPGQRILDDTRAPFYRWYPDATLNTC